MKYPCEIIEQPTQGVLSIRTRASVDQLPQVFDKAFYEIMIYLSENGVHPAGAPFAAYYNMDMQDLDIEIGFPVNQTLLGNNEIQPNEIPAGRQAACLYTGPYNQLEQAYHQLSQWVKENGYTPTGIAYEFYLNDPSVTPENELQTKIVFPLI